MQGLLKKEIQRETFSSIYQSERHHRIIDHRLLEGHGTESGLRIHIGTYKVGCKYPSTTLVKKKYKRRARYKKPSSLRAEHPQYDIHWHYSSEYEDIEYGEPGYDDSCNNYRPNDCETIRDEYWRGFCYTDNDSTDIKCRKEEENAYPPPDSTAIKSSGLEIHYYDVDEYEDCEWEIIRP